MLKVNVKFNIFKLEVEFDFDLKILIYRFKYEFNNCVKRIINICVR